MDNECLKGPCLNTPGNYLCLCNTGYSGNGFICSDINECLDNPCYAYATCFSKPGSFELRCNQVFKGNGIYYSDINECLHKSCNQYAPVITLQDLMFVRAYLVFLVMDHHALRLMNAYIILAIVMH